MDDLGEDAMTIEDFQKLLMNQPFVSDGDTVKVKINTVARMHRIYKNLRENSDLILKIKMVNDGRIPRGLLIQGKSAIRNAMKDFALASELDSENEKRPTPKKY